MCQTARTIRGDFLRSPIAAAATLIAMTCLHAAGSESRTPAGALPRIKVSPNGRFLITENHKPFFWLGDTGWWMTGISPAEVDVYLAKRAKQQFNVIQFHCGRLVKDYAGRLPFRRNDALAPDEEYWRNIDSIVTRAGDHGLYIALVPLWGEEYGRLFGSDAARASQFGRWIGARYASRTNVLWIASGEHDSINGFRLPITAAQKAALTAAARGIREATAGRQLITVHPGAARTSSSDFHNEPWLDFNMLQSGHQMNSEAYKLAENHALITHDYGLTPVKPVLDGEPIYEDTPDAIWIERNVNKPRAGAAAVRRKAYWSVFAGACGHTYGNNNVYGFFVPPSPGFVQKLPGGPGNRESWKTALDAPGGAQLLHLRALIESRPFLTQVPAPSLLGSPPGAGNDRMGALRGDGYAMLYTPLGRSFSVRLDRLGWRDATLTWFDPRSGQREPAGKMAATGLHEFDPPGEPGDGNDWVLVLEEGKLPATDTASPRGSKGPASRPLPSEWRNPLEFSYTEDQSEPRREVRDPCILREGDTYYLVFTMWPFRNREEQRLGESNQGGSPGIALYSSRDLKQWKFENWLVRSSELPDNCPYKNRFWAPEIHKIGGKFYLIFTADNWLKKEYNPAGSWGTAGYAFIGVADKITGPYEHVTYLPGGACDTTLFEDTDGRTYAFIPRGNVDVQEIDLRGLAHGRLRLVGQPKKVVTADNADIGMKARPEYLEGPWALKIGKRYYLFFAGPYSEKKFPDQAGYWTGVAYADHVLGPYRKDPRGQVFHGGHLAVFNGPDGLHWFSYRHEQDRRIRGLLCVDPFDLDDQGMVRCLSRATSERP